MAHFPAPLAGVPAGLLTEAEVWSRVGEATRAGLSLSRHTGLLNSVLTSQLATAVMGPALSLPEDIAATFRGQLLRDIESNPGLNANIMNGLIMHNENHTAARNAILNFVLEKQVLLNQMVLERIQSKLRGSSTNTLAELLREITGSETLLLTHLGALQEHQKVLGDQTSTGKTARSTLSSTNAQIETDFTNSETHNTGLITEITRTETVLEEIEKQRATLTSVGTLDEYKRRKGDLTELSDLQQLTEKRKNKLKNDLYAFYSLTNNESKIIVDGSKDHKSTHSIRDRERQGERACPEGKAVV
jgi:hypothetical protein